MGRIKGFFCSFCLDGSSAEQSNHEASFDRNIDVSHLATPHITASPSQIQERSSPLSNRFEDNNEDNYMNHASQQQRLTPNNCTISSQQHQSSQRESIISNHQDDRSPYARSPSSLHLDNSSPQPSFSPSSASPANNIYEPQNVRREPSSPESQQRQLPPPRDPTPPPVLPRNPTPTTSSNGPATKLSYDIISVREPLAKILAERQQLLQSQQQQRQLLGDHDYIEVYGERGSSCFYEEIAGSVTSSATYDQIGTNSNHNYQVLINAYAGANRHPVINQDDNTDNNRIGNGSSTNSNGTNNDHRVDTYGVTSKPSDQVDGPSTSARSALPTASSPATTTCNPADNQEQPTLYQSDETRQNAPLTQSIPVYSVINKATRRTSSTIRSTIDNNRPPEPPPKNLLVSHHHNQQQPINNSNESSSFPRTWSPLSQIPSTSSNTDRNVTNESNFDDSFNLVNNHRHARLPQPPPRFSKHSAFNHTTDRPLPSPNGHYDSMHNNNNGPMLDRNNINENDDSESIDNGYELLMSNNIEDDQIDVGYEKIKESNRYSGGSISSQFYQRQFLDNGGYESVQPIYSSPSNALVEPNYEAIAPATASGLAAAATAKLNAMSVIERILKKD